MKPAPFQYHRAASVDDAVALLQEFDPDARILAGGQSLLPMMNFRLAQPAHLIDIGSVRELDELVYQDDALQIGARVTHRQVETIPADLLRFGHRLLPAAMRWVGHLPIRTRGTVGGSIAHGDATAEWIQLALAYEASIGLRGPTGRREVQAADFFIGPYMTDLNSDEMVVDVTFPATRRPGGISEYARRKGDFALASAVALAPTQHESAALVVTGVTPMAVRLQEAEQLWSDGHSIGEVVRAAVAEADIAETGPVAGKYAESLLRAVLQRACDQALNRQKNGLDDVDQVYGESR